VVPKLRTMAVGWIVYREGNGEMIKYYRSSGPARSKVTRHNKALAQGGYVFPRGKLACCTFQLYEGVLMGLRGDELDMWRFLNGKKKP